MQLIKAGFLIIGLSIVTLLSLQTHGDSQDSGEQATPSLDTTVLNLVLIHQQLEQLESEHAKTRQWLESANESSKVDLQEAMLDLKQKIAAKQKIFREIASGEEDPDITQLSDRGPVSISTDISEIISPIIAELKALTARPRQIDSLKNKIKNLNASTKIDATRLKNINEHIALTTDHGLKKRLENYAKQIAISLEDAKQEIGTVELKLRKIEDSSNQSLFDASQSVLNFLKTTAFHLVLAFFAALAFYILMYWISDAFAKKVIEKSQLDQIFFKQLLRLVLKLAGVIGSIVVYFFILFTLNDWLLMVLSGLLLAVAAISLKDIIPKYLVEVRTLMNLGSLREGEVVEYESALWKLGRLDVYTELHNKQLDGKLRVPLSKLTEINSRKFSRDQKLFPCEEGDWVILNNTMLVQVEMQNMTYVQVRYLDAPIFYKTSTFLDNNPCNLSQGSFIITTPFGIDYQHQQDCTTTIPTQLKEYLSTKSISSDFSEFIKEIKIEFLSASTSSLDYRIFISCNSNGASAYFQIERWVQKECVNFCNLKDLIIPFQQITLHTAKT